jgi:hypothetical protein
VRIQPEITALFRKGVVSHVSKPHRCPSGTHPTSFRIARKGEKLVASQALQLSLFDERELKRNAVTAASRAPIGQVVETSPATQGPAVHITGEKPRWTESVWFVQTRRQQAFGLHRPSGDTTVERAFDPSGFVDLKVRAIHHRLTHRRQGSRVAAAFASKD